MNTLRQQWFYFLHLYFNLFKWLLFHRVAIDTSVDVYYTTGRQTGADTNLQADQWYHLAIVIPQNPKSNNLILYQDDVNVYQRQFESGSRSRSPGIGKLVIGRKYTDLDGNYVNTVMDELVFWNRTLTGDEIKSIYESYIPSND